jgi:hypothetical protein
MKALTEAGSLGGSKLNLKGSGWKTDGIARSMDGDEVASGTDCTVMSGTRLTPSKPFASVLASSIRLGLACCRETSLVVVSGARSTPDVSPAGALASSTRSTVNEVPPPAWPRLPRLLHLRRGRRRDRPGCCSSATGGRRRRFREGESLFVSPSSRATTFLYEGPGPFFYRCKERVQVYNGGCSNMLTCSAERSQSLMYMPTWLSERC